MLAVVPEGNNDWKPQEKSMSLGSLATHIASLPAHHRAQLGVYLRLLGVPIPGTYGPSADEKMA